jgi:predicted RNase H-like HicB family nuclease
MGERRGRQSLVSATSERYDNGVTDELVFEVTQESDGGFYAECLTDSIVTEGDTWEELRKNVREVVRAFYFDQPERIPALIRLHLVRNEVFASA